MPFKEYLTLNEFLEQAEHQLKTKRFNGKGGICSRPRKLHV